MSELAAVTGGGGDTAQAIARALPNCLAPGRRELDVTDMNQVRDYMKQHRPKILVNCAGYIKPASVKESLPGEWKKELEVNLLGTYYCTHFALIYGATKIINIASAAGLKGRGNWSGYSAAKAGVISFTQALVEEGIEAYCVSPHRIATKMRKGLFPEEDKNSLMSPRQIADIVCDIVRGAFPVGAHIDVALSGFTIL